MRGTIGFFMMTIGGMFGDSENILIPIIIMLIGGLLMLSSEKGEC